MNTTIFFFEYEEQRVLQNKRNRRWKELYEIVNERKREVIDVEK